VLAPIGYARAADPAPVGTGCTGTIVTTGVFFQNYEQIEYSPAGLLILHFKINPILATGRTVKTNWNAKNDECSFGNILGMPDVSVKLPTGVTDFSLRFASPTHYDIWNDASSTPLDCSSLGLPSYQTGCSVDILDFPDYYTFGFKSSASIGTSFSTFKTSFHPIIADPPLPPVLIDTLPTPEGCVPVRYGTTSFFDDYEKARYVGGLLELHYRMNVPNDGLNFKTFPRLHDELCRTSSPNVNIPPNTSIEKPARYWSVRFTSPTHYDIWNDDLNKIEICQKCSVDIATTTSDGKEAKYFSLQSTVGPNLSFIKGTPYPVVEPPPPVTGHSSVIFLPGLQASRLSARSNSFNQLWEPGGNSDVETLYLNPDGSSVAPDIYTTGVIDELFGALNIYKSFIADMNSLVADGTIKAWEAFPYDWRVDPRDIITGGVETTAGHYNMITELEQLASSSATGKVTIISHSNGGLVAKSLIDKLREQGKESLVDQLILVAVPQIGTPKAVSTLMHGDDIGLIQSLFMDQVHQRTLAENMTSAYNMMPSNEYFSRVIDPIIEFDDSTDSGQAIPAQLINWVERYGFAINTPAELHDFVSGGDGRSEPADSDVLAPNVLKATQLAQSESNHAFFDTWQAPANVKVTQIVGWGLDTVRGMRYVARERSVCQPPSGSSTAPVCTRVPFIDHEPIFTEDGDETVVTPSVSMMATSTYFVNLFRHNKLTQLNTNREHSDVLEVSSLLDLVKNLITKDEDSYAYIGSEKPVTAETDKRLRLRVLSPVSLSVSDSQGKVTALTSVTIPNSYYLEFGEGKYVGLDTEDTYTLKLEGLDMGTFTLEINELAGEQITGALTYQDVPVTPDTIVTMTLNDLESASNLKIDVDGDGTVDQELNPGEDVTPVDQLNILKKIITDLDLRAPDEKSLLAKIKDAISLIQKGNLNGAEHKLGDLQNQLQAMSGKSLDQATVINLLQIIETIKNSI